VEAIRPETTLEEGCGCMQKKHIYRLLMRDLSEPIIYSPHQVNQTWHFPDPNKINSYDYKNILVY
jgi:hypothetical protein